MDGPQPPGDGLSSSPMLGSSSLLAPGGGIVLVRGVEVPCYRDWQLRALPLARLREHARVLRSALGPELLAEDLPQSDEQLPSWVHNVHQAHVEPLREPKQLLLQREGRTLAFYGEQHLQLLSPVQLRRHAEALLEALDGAEASSSEVPADAAELLAFATQLHRERVAPLLEAGEARVVERPGLLAGLAGRLSSPLRRQQVLGPSPSPSPRASPPPDAPPNLPSPPHPVPGKAGSSLFLSTSGLPGTRLFQGDDELRPHELRLAGAEPPRGSSSSSSSLRPLATGHMLTALVPINKDLEDLWAEIRSLKASFRSSLAAESTAVASRGSGGVGSTEVQELRKQLVVEAEVRATEQQSLAGRVRALEAERLQGTGSSAAERLQLERLQLRVAELEQQSRSQLRDMQAKLEQHELARDQLGERLGDLEQAQFRERPPSSRAEHAVAELRAALEGSEAQCQERLLALEAAQHGGAAPDIVQSSELQEVVAELRTELARMESQHLERLLALEAAGKNGHAAEVQNSELQHSLAKLRAELARMESQSQERLLALEAAAKAGDTEVQHRELEHYVAELRTELARVESQSQERLLALEAAGKNGNAAAEATPLSAAAPEDVVELRTALARVESHCQERLLALEEGLEGLTAAQGGHFGQLAMQLEKHFGSQHCRLGKLEGGPVGIEELIGAQRESVEALEVNFAELGSECRLKCGELGTEVSQLGEASKLQLGRLGDLEQSLSRLERTLTTQDGQFQGCQTMVGKLEDAVGTNMGRLFNVQGTFGKLEEHIVIHTHWFDELRGKCCTLEDALSTQTGVVGDLGNSLTRFAAKLESLGGKQQRDVGDLSDSLAKLETLVDSHHNEHRVSCDQLQLQTSRLEELLSSVQQHFAVRLGELHQELSRQLEVRSAAVQQEASRLSELLAAQGTRLEAAERALTESAERHGVHDRHFVELRAQLDGLSGQLDRLEGQGLNTAQLRRLEGDVRRQHTMLAELREQLAEQLQQSAASVEEVDSRTTCFELQLGTMREEFLDRLEAREAAAARRVKPGGQQGPAARGLHRLEEQLRAQQGRAELLQRGQAQLEAQLETQLAALRQPFADAVRQLAARLEEQSQRLGKLEQAGSSRGEGAEAQRKDLPLQATDAGAIGSADTNRLDELDRQLNQVLDLFVVHDEQLTKLAQKVDEGEPRPGPQAGKEAFSQQHLQLAAAATAAAEQLAQHVSNLDGQLEGMEARMRDYADGGVKGLHSTLVRQLEALEARVSQLDIQVGAGDNVPLELRRSLGGRSESGDLTLAAMEDRLRHYVDITVARHRGS